MDGLILPVIFSGSHLITEDSDDEIAQLIARTQYVAFDEVWPMERNSERWIAAIREMAKSIIRIEKSAEEQLSRALTAEALTPSRTSPGNANTPSRQPIDIEALENEDGDDDPQIIELTEQLDQGFRSLATKITSATEHFTDVADRVGMWGDLQRPKNPKAVNQYFFNIAHEIDAPSRQFHRAAAEAYNEAIAVDTAIRQMRQLTHSMTDSTARDTFNGVLRNGFLSSSSGTMNTIDQLEKLAPMIADAERLSALLKKSLRPTRSGIQIIKDVGGMMLDWGRLADLEDNDEREPIAIPSAS